MAHRLHELTVTVYRPERGITVHGILGTPTPLRENSQAPITHASTQSAFKAVNKSTFHPICFQRVQGHTIPSVQTNRRDRAIWQEITVHQVNTELTDTVQSTSEEEQLNEDQKKEFVKEAVFSILTQPEYGEDFITEFLGHVGIQDPSAETILEADNAVMEKLRELSHTL